MTEFVFKLAGEIGSRVKLWHLGCTMDPHAALLSCQAMAGEVEW